MMSLSLNELLQGYFLLEQSGGELLSASYNPILVVLSYFVAVFAAYTTLSLITHMRNSYDTNSESARYWWMGSAVTLGGGIFVMHFVGMLAFSIPVPIRYDLGITLLSLLVAITASAFALHLIREQPIKWLNVISGALVMGTGVAAMHYVGMAGLLAPALLRYTVGLWVLSVLIAVTVSLAAILLLHYASLTHRTRSPLWKLSVALVMGVAVAGMHYTGMAAAEFYSGGVCGMNSGLFNIELESFQLGVSITIISLLIIGIGLIASLFNKRMNDLLVEKNHELALEVEAQTEQLREQNSELSQLQRALDHHAIVSATDAYGNIVFVNDKFCEISGYSREELLGQNHRVVKSTEHTPEFYQQMWKTISSGEVWQGEIKNLKKGGEDDYWVNATITPFFNPEGVIKKYIAIRTDITAIKRFEHQLMQKNTDLFEAKNIAEAANKAKDNFLAIMSHEIRTPMNTIIGMSHLALQLGLNNKQHNYISKVHTAGQGLLGIINDILDFSKVSSGKMELETMPFSLHDLFDEVVGMMEHAAQSKSIRLTHRFDAAIPSALLGDSLRLTQIVNNLGSNALKFTPDGGNIEITIDLEEQREDKRVLLHFRVQDDGIGMSTEEMRWIFNTFTQADVSTTRKFGGTGLGLAITKRLVEIMGGELWVESERGGGSTFHFTALFEQSEDGLGSFRNGEAEPKRAEEQLQGARILLVDDNDLNQELAYDILTNVGIDVVIANHGAEAVDILSTEEFDGVLMDIQMPVMDGYAASRAIRETLQQSDLPILALTSNVIKGDREKALEAGMNDHIGKPIDADVMLATMAKWIPSVVPVLAVDEEQAGQPLTECESSQAPVEVEWDTLMPLLTELKTLLAENNFKAALIAEQVGEQLHNTAYAELSNSITTAIDAFDFDEAMGQLDRLLSKPNESV